MKIVRRSRLSMFEGGVVLAVLILFSQSAKGIQPPESHSKPDVHHGAARVSPNRSVSVATTVDRSRVVAQSVVGGICRFDYECDDCNLCTDDRCLQQSCVNTPRSQCQSCDDGVFCNGLEICDAIGNCQDAAPGMPCAQFPGTICDDEVTSLAGGACVTPCTIDADCEDGEACSGTEVCELRTCIGGDNSGSACQSDVACDTTSGGFCGGVCRHIDLPCGVEDACREDFCDIIGGTNPGSPIVIGFPCTSDGDCADFGTGHCTVGIGCAIMGRCCTDDQAGNGDLLECTRSNRPECTANGGLWLFVGDDPGVVGDEGRCGKVVSPIYPNAGEDFQCPLYSGGIAPVGTYGTTLGPIGQANCATLHEVGDDYEIAGAQAGNDYVEVTTVRFVGGFQVDGVAGAPGFVQIRFYDEAGTMVARVTADLGRDGSTQLRTVIVPKIVVPSRGWVSLAPSLAFSPFGRPTWASTDGVDVGANDASQIWVNGAPVDASTILPPGEAGVLAFEIVGNVVADPLGACCDSGAAMCSEQLPWNCSALGDQFQGAGSFCRSCSNDRFLSCVDAADCPACVGGSNDGATCDVLVDCPEGICISGVCHGGINDTKACEPDECPGGSCSGTVSCDPVLSACTSTACCDTVTGSCIEVTGGRCSDTLEACRDDTDCEGAGSVCEPPCPAGTVSSGFGTTCVPNLCLQPLTGWDTCSEAGLVGNTVALDVASLDGCDQVTVTSSGSNLWATFNDSPGTCDFGIFDQNGLTQDRGWWHAFNVNACANVRIEFCGTEERTGVAKQLAWSRLWKDCNPCTTTISASLVGGDAQGGCVGDEAQSQGPGGPFCAGDDAWFTFGPLAPGTYWYPVYSAPDGSVGEYQLHVTASACAEAACCLSDSLCVRSDESLAFDLLGEIVPCVDDSSCSALAYCDNNAGLSCVIDDDCPACVGGSSPGLSCAVDADCGTGGTCSGFSTCTSSTCGFCAVLNELECDDRGGNWNGFGSTRLQCRGGYCLWGVCENGEDDGYSCDPFGGEIVTSCTTGACDIGACCTGIGACDDRAFPAIPCDTANPETCLDRAMCDGIAEGVFHGGSSCFEPAPPCSACEFIGESNCQYPLNGGFTFMSDLAGPGNGVVSADDFVPFGGTISEVCVWGAYLDPSDPGNVGPAGYEQFGCAGMVSDHFRIRVFEDDDGLPGTMIGESEVTGTNMTKGLLSNTFFEAVYGIVIHGYTLILDPPISGLVAGQRHWLEVANYTPLPEENTCFWHWAMHMPEDRDGYCASGVSPKSADFPNDMFARPSVYVDGSAHGGTDLAFCLRGPDGPFEFVSPPDDTAACWTCGGAQRGPTCSIETLMQCMRSEGMWNRTDRTCGDSPPVMINDNCRTPEPSALKVGSVTCGDGILDPGEQCDDGNADPYDGCDANCLLECSITPIDSSPGALHISEGLFGFDNMCASDDGPTLVRGEGGESSIGGDIWYQYTSSGTGWMTASLCPTQTGWTKDGYTGLDTIFGIYHEDVTRCDGGANDGFECVCPGNPPQAKCIDVTQCPGTTVCDEDGLPPGCSNVAIGMCRNFCPCPGRYVGVSPLQIGAGSDEGCNGIADLGSGFQTVLTFPGECFLIRAGIWQTAGAVPWEPYGGRGLLDVSFAPTSCFPSSPPEPERGPNIAGIPVPWIKSRMLSFWGGDAGLSQAVRVTWVQMPPGWESWEGQSLFAQEPWWGSEAGGTSFYDPVTPGTPNSLQLAELGCEPFFTDWSQYGLVHIIHPAIVPSTLLTPSGPADIFAAYDIQIVEEGCDRSRENRYSSALQLRTAGWGDVVSLFNGTYSLPEDVVNIADTVAMVAKFGGQVDAPSKASLSLLGVVTGPVPRLDGKTTISELLAVLGAFGGENFPFLPADIPSPPGPCP